MLQALGISKSYHRAPVLQAVDFCLGAGQCLGIAGENGSGKSTLLKICAQVLTPDSGDILYQGKSILGDRVFLRQMVGYVPQQCDLLPLLTCREQLSLWQSACGVATPLSGELSEILKLPELMDIPIGQMSGGMCRRVSIALALSNQPRILIMDEATTGLDAACREDLLTWLEEYLSRGGRMLWCSHYAQETERLCGAGIITLK